MYSDSKDCTTVGRLDKSSLANLRNRGHQQNSSVEVKIEALGCPTLFSHSATLKKSVLINKVSKPGCPSFFQVSWYATFLGRKDRV